MDSEELQETLALLEEQGWKPLLCDTSIPFYDNPVACGTPVGVGDVVKGKRMWPREFLSMQPEFIITVQGDSMKDAGITEGDSVKVEMNARVHDGDIVLTCVGGEYTLKTYCEDNDGCPWLVPQNEAYEAFPLTESDDVWIVGVVTQLIKQAPRIGFSSCIRHINKAKSKQLPTPTRQQVEEAVADVSAMIKNGRQWYAAFRPLVDKKYLGKAEYDAFCDLVASVVPRHEHLPDAEQMQRMAVQSFAKPVMLWDEANAPVKGKPFKDYKRIAERMLELL